MMHSAIYMVGTMTAFATVMAIMINGLDINSGQAFGFTVVVVSIALIGDIIRKRLESQGKASPADQTQMQADINELKKRVDEMQEQIAELYIQQHSPELK